MPAALTPTYAWSVASSSYSVEWVHSISFSIGFASKLAETWFGLFSHLPQITQE